MVISLKLINKFRVTPIRIPAGFIVEIDKLILKSICNGMVLRIAKTSLEKEQNKAGGLTLPYFKIYWDAIKIKP